MEQFYLGLLGVSFLLVLLLLVLCIAYYVVMSLGHMKALKAMGYQNAWMAWIPFANYYALADVTAGKQETFNLFSTQAVPAAVYKLWWVGMILLWFIGIIIHPLASICTLASTVLRVIFLGTCYIKMYAVLDRTDEQSQQILGYISGFMPIIAAFKFLLGKYDTTKVM